MVRISLNIERMNRLLSRFFKSSVGDEIYQVVVNEAECHLYSSTHSL